MEKHRLSSCGVEVELDMPFPLKTNPLAQEAWPLTVQWVKTHSLVRDPKLLWYFENKLDYYWLSAYAFPTADLPRLAQINDWMTFFYLVDLVLDDQVGDEHLKDVSEWLMAALRGKLRDSASAKEKALANLGRRIREGGYSSKEWLERFTGKVENYIKTCCNREFKARHHNKKVSSVEEYLPMRRATSGVRPSFELAGVLGLVNVPPTVLNRKELVALSDHANDVITVFNDLISLEKELAKGDTHNLVLIIEEEAKAKQEACSRAQAIQRTAQVHNKAISDFLKEQAKLELKLTEREAKLKSELASGKASASDSEDLKNIGTWTQSTIDGVRGYLDVLRCWMRSNMNWSIMSERYKSKSAA
ncbi:terpene synthase family protein [Archangium lansingense]|uniref:Terpene synthase n=1 Tax=Archangium lansingense TaxID=2995310 RepID=A0ABT4A0Q6_9BACT|nr:hypothetical protein [Archangium lansinium]MCY1074931.1 hypothetical protein [Archangium lansinium]